MRNLALLSKLGNTLSEVEDLDDQVAAACLDEFGHLLIVYTKNHNLHAYKFNPAKLDAELTPIASEHLDQVEGEGVFIVALDFV